ncbi:helix-turn-helix domain-containing protein [Mesoplasma photuris]|uniref:helix-turn-helix domain-containing protein n=1 Tax=Mesoplasma photuris TaxID=217731 RepID=UPI0004E2362D|nr:helix-turn-helix domain-containing protein [Mesoplasma photuris]
MPNIRGTKSNILTFEQKKEMVSDFLDNHYSFVKLSKKYKISYSAVRKNIKNWQILGDEALKSKTGKGNKGNFNKLIENKNNENHLLKEEILKLRNRLKEVDPEYSY